MYIILGMNTRTICLETQDELDRWNEDSGFRTLLRAASKRLWVSEIHNDLDGLGLDALTREHWIGSDEFENYDWYCESEKGKKYAERYIGSCITGHFFFLYLNGEK